MKQIALTQGKYAIVDDADYEMLMQFKWFAHKATTAKSFYAIHSGAYNNGKQKATKMHRLIMGVNDPMVHIDHKDGNGLNNQRDNLRICTKADNLRNRPKYVGASKYKGVCYKQSNKKWVAQISVNGKPTHLGYFNNQQDAAKAYNEAATKHHGEFALLNII